MIDSGPRGPCGRVTEYGAGLIAKRSERDSNARNREGVCFAHGRTDTGHARRAARIPDRREPPLAAQRRRFRRFPASPRCKLCAAPFAGLGGLVFGAAGFGRFSGNPAMCKMCITQLRKNGMSGIEIPVSLLFTDVRGSTAMGERMRPTEFHAFLDHFYRLASDAILEHDGLVDKIVGDEVIGLFFGGVSGPAHAAAAISAALDLAERAQHRERRRRARSPPARLSIPAMPSSVRRGRRERSTISPRSAMRSIPRPAWRPPLEPARCSSAYAAAIAAGTPTMASSDGPSISAAGRSRSR